MKGSDVFIKALENEGVEYIFGVPGEENLDFLDSLKNSNIELIITRHEQAAGFMAATYGRLTGKAGVVLTTLGPGATNLVTAASYAFLGGMPLIMITGQKPINDSKQGKFQIIDTVEIMRPITKYSTQIVHANRISSTVREGFKIAESEKPGPVHIVLPEDIAREETNYSPIKFESIRRPIAEEKAINKAVKMIEESKSPLILVGAAANRTLTSKMLTEFINKSGIPFFNTQMGKGVIDERNEKFIGTAALSQNDLIHEAIDQADLIINVGHDVIEKPPFIMKGSDTRKVIHINFFPANIDNIYFPQLEVIGDIANAIWQISEKININSSWNFEKIYDSKSKIDKHIGIQCSEETWPISPAHLVDIIRQKTDEDSVISLDNGLYKLWFARNFKAYCPNSLILDNALATMGAGLPAAIGAKITKPEKNIIAIVGDGGFMMNSQELETMKRLDLPIIIIVLKDNAYGMIKWKQDAMNLESFGLDFDNPDFAKYAESYGIEGQKVDSVHTFKSILESSLSSNKSILIELPIDYSQKISY